MDKYAQVIIQTNKPTALCFTPDRLIFANVGVTRLIWVLVLFGLLGGLIIGPVQSSVRSKKIKQLKELSTESILKADKKNFAVPYVELGLVQLFKKMGARKIRITAGTNRYEYWLAKPKEFDDYVRVLRPVLADKLAIA